MSVNSKMTALADEIRELSGTEETMGLDAMANHIGEANTDVATEAGLIEQIASALEGKAGGGNDNNIKYFTVRNNLPDDIIINGAYCPYGSSVDIPYDEEYISSIAVFAINGNVDYTFRESHIEMVEDEDGGFHEESFDSDPEYVRFDDYEAILGILSGFTIGEHIKDNTITLEVVE
jgi:hypothetical protein